MHPVRLIPLVLAALLAALVLAWALGDRPVSAPATPLEADGPRGSEPPGPEPLRAERLPAAGEDGTNADPASGAGGAAAARAALSGLVQDETGRPLPGARVTLRAMDPQGLRGAPYPDGPLLAETLSDAEGAFALEARAGMWLRVRASAPGRATVARRVASAGARIVLVLPPAGALHVEVLDHAGAPAAGVAVEAVVAETPLESTTDAAGLARLDALPPGPVRVRAGGGAHPAIVAGPFAVRAGAVTQALLVLPRVVQLAGLVVDAGSGRPIADAVVHVAHPGRSEAAPPTDAQGRFGPLPGGGVGERVFLAVEAEGFAPLREPVVLRGPGQQTVELRLTAATAWEGTVRHADGRPAAGADVGYTPDGVAGLAPAATTSDAQGRFALPPPPRPAPGRRIVLTARLGDAVGALALRPDTPRPPALVLTLQPGASVRGTLRGSAGEGLGGVVVRLTPAWDQVPRGASPDEATARLLAANERGFQGLATASAPDGRWRVAGVPAGPYRVHFERDGSVTTRAETLAVRGAEVDAGLQTLGAGLVIEGRVRDADGTPLAGVSVRVAPAGDSTAARSAVTDLEGGFRIEAVDAGRHRLSATWPGREPLVGEVDVDEVEGARIELAFEEGALLRARVRHADRPWSGVLTVALQAESGREDPRATRHVRVRGGVVELAGVAPGTWYVEASSPLGLRAHAGPVETAAGRTAEVLLDLQAAARVHGAVLDPDGRAVAGASVLLRDVETGRRRLATSDVGGRWQFDDVRPGRYALEARGPGGARVEDALDLAAGEVVERDLALLRAGVLDVRVLDDRGRPVAGALVGVRTEDGTLRTAAPPRTDAQGRVQIPDVPPGLVVLRARAPDGRVGTAQVVVDVGAAPTSAVVRVTSAGPR